MRLRNMERVPSPRRMPTWPCPRLRSCCKTLAGRRVGSYERGNRSTRSARITPTGAPCPICGEGTPVVHVEDNVVEYAGVRSAIPSRYQVCTACGSEQADMEYLRFGAPCRLSRNRWMDGTQRKPQDRRSLRNPARMVKPIRPTGGCAVITVSSVEAQNELDRLLDAVQQEPVAITRNGQMVAALVSPADFRLLEDFQAARNRRRENAAEFEALFDAQAGTDSRRTHDDVANRGK